jgi:Icc-related predicted phosphoesterase
MKICCISDTHSHHRKLTIPDADILVHAGDISWRGELPIIQDFANWLKEIPIKHKIVIFGNHEIGLERGPKRDPAIKMIKDSGAIYLEDSGITIDGINFWGSPIQPWFHDWEFNRQRGKDIDFHWKKIPDNTHVLITHGPPYMIRDLVPRGVFDHENVGCVDLLNRISDLKELKMHVFGHIHSGYGVTKIEQCSFVNASSCTESYAPSNAPIVVEI